MTSDELDSRDPRLSITRAEYRFIALWSIAILLSTAISGYFCVRQLVEYKNQTRQSRQAWIESVSTDSSALMADVGDNSGRKPTDVQVGMSLDRISEINLQEAGWTADFHIWFRWTGDDVDPGKNFQIVNGRILEKTELQTQVSNGQRYEHYRVTARMIKYFDPARFPFSAEGLIIEVVDAVDGADRLRFLADEQSGDVRHLAAPQGVTISRTIVAVKAQGYGPSRSEAAAPDRGETVHSLFIVGMLGKPIGTSVYFRLFITLFAAVAVSVIVFFIKPLHVDPRFGLPVGAFFAATGNNIYVGTLLPLSERVTLAQMVNAVTVVTILLILIQSAISLRIFDSMGRERFSRVFDIVSFVVIVSAYLALNLILPLAARL